MPSSKSTVNPSSVSTNRFPLTLVGAASNARVLQRELVQKTVHQIHEYNDEGDGMFLKPLIETKKFTDNWHKQIAGLSTEEVADMEDARAALEHYEKIYGIYEYCSELTELCNMVETRICANNPSLPMNMYRRSASSSMSHLFPEIEKCLEAYYNLLDDCEQYPDWHKKIQKELGGTVSYLALAMDESSRDLAVEISEPFRRFDQEKQLYFK